MKEAKLKVRLIKYTQDPERVCAEAARLCNYPISVEEMGSKLDSVSITRIINFVVKQGHSSVLEHANFTFAIEGISRACSHELVRHRIASYSQQSQRHVNEANAAFVIPQSVKENPEMLKKYVEFLEESQKVYEELEKHGVPREDARFILPNACETRIVVTMNARALMNFFELRNSEFAQWEIRALASEMLRQVKNVAPNIFDGLKPLV